MKNISEYVVNQLNNKPNTEVKKVEGVQVEKTGGSVFSEIENFSKQKLRKVEFSFPEKCEKVLNALVEIGVNHSDFEDEEFKKLTKDYYRILNENKARKRPPTPPSGGPSSGGGGSSGRRWKVVDHFQDDDTTHLNNVKFYKGEITLNEENNGEYITDIHQKWFGKYTKLEIKHDYIQWLFPIRESGLNGRAQSITKNEAKIFQETPELQKRVIQSYRLILDFFGIVLISEKTGKLERNDWNWEARSHNLNTSSHNYLRITRILKCLGIMGLEHLKLNFVKFMIEEVLKYKSLENATSSLLRYWIPTLRKQSELIEAERLVFEITGKKVKRSEYDVETDNWSNVKIMDVEEKKEEESEKDFYEIPRSTIFRRQETKDEDEEKAKLEKQRKNEMRMKDAQLD